MTRVLSIEPSAPFERLLSSPSNLYDLAFEFGCPACAFATRGRLAPAANALDPSANIATARAATVRFGPHTALRRGVDVLLREIMTRLYLARARPYRLFSKRRIK